MVLSIFVLHIEKAASAILTEAALFGLRRLVVERFIILHGTDSQEYAKERIDCGNGANDFLTIGKTPDRRKTEVQSTDARKQILGNPL